MSGDLSFDEFEALFNAANDGTIPYHDEADENDDQDDGTDDDDQDDGTDDDSDDDTDGDDQPDNNDNAITTQEDFDEWAWTRDVPENDVLNCGFDIRNEWHNGYYLWAGQNCEIYDLWVRIYFPAGAWVNGKIWESSDMDLVEESCDAAADECNALFKITPSNPRLGLAFSGTDGEVNFRFETERWAPCVAEMME